MRYALHQLAFTDTAHAFPGALTTPMLNVRDRLKRLKCAENSLLLFVTPPPPLLSAQQVPKVSAWHCESRRSLRVLQVLLIQMMQHAWRLWAGLQVWGVRGTFSVWLTHEATHCCCCWSAAAHGSLRSDCPFSPQTPLLIVHSVRLISSQTPNNQFC